MLNKSGKSEHSGLVPDLSYLLPLIILLSVFHRRLLSGWGNYLLFLLCRILLLGKGVRLYQCSFCIYWDGNVVSVLYYINMINYIDWFSYIEPTLLSWLLISQIPLFVVYIFLIYCWIQILYVFGIYMYIFTYIFIYIYIFIIFIYILLDLVC